MKRRYGIEYYDGRLWRRAGVVEIDEPPRGPLTRDTLAAVLKPLPKTGPNVKRPAGARDTRR